MNEEIDWLEQKLHEEMPYIDDAGFTARVLQQIPARPRRHSLRAMILLAMALLGGATTFVFSDGGSFLIRTALRLSLLSVTSLMVIAVVLGLAVTLAAAVAAMLAQNSREN